MAKAVRRGFLEYIMRIVWDGLVELGTWLHSPVSVAHYKSAISLVRRSGLRWQNYCNPSNMLCENRQFTLFLRVLFGSIVTGDLFVGLRG